MTSPGPAPADAVAYLGPEGTFTAEAARRAAPDAELLPRPTIDDVVDDVRDGRVPLGVVPVENSIEGSVSTTLDALAFGAPGVYIRGEVTLAISMAVLAGEGTGLGDVTVVRSHPHALAQCRRWLTQHLPAVALEAAPSTADAAREAAASPGVAALGPATAADRYGLDVLAEDVHDHTGNSTRFLVLGRAMAPAAGADRTSVVVFFGEDRPGLLMRVLDEFALRDINLTKVESRPTKKGLGEYCIFIDAAGHVTESRLAAALRSVHRHVAELRVLGAYPRADGIADPPAPVEADAAYAEADAWYAELRSRISDS